MNLLQSRIQKSCSLALPEGLKDLMSDISREVLRAQPNNLPQFISGYLEVLLEVREKLSIACHICTESCKIICEPELYNELKAIGVSDENIDITIQVVEDYWDQKNVKEQSLLIKLAKKISIDEMQLPLIRDAVQKAIKIHHIKDSALSGSNNKNDKVTDGLNHTLNWYRVNKTTTEEVFLAPNFEPCLSTVSPTDPEDHLKLPKYRAFSDHETENEKEYGSFDYSLYSAGKVKFKDEKIFFTPDLFDKATKNFDGINENDYAKNTNYKDDDDSIADDENGINDESELTDNDIEENIKSDSHEDTTSSVDEDFIT